MAFELNRSAISLMLGKIDGHTHESTTVKNNEVFEVERQKSSEGERAEDGGCICEATAGGGST